MQLLGAASGGALRPRLSQEFLDGHKRERILTAVCELAHEQGAGELTAMRIAKQARVARPAIYQLFGDAVGCRAFACEEARRHLAGSIEAAAEAAGPWPDQMGAAIGGLLEAAAERPLLAELGLVHAAGIEGRDSGESGCAQAVIDALTEVASGGLESWTAELVACAIVAVVTLRVRERAAELPFLREELTAMAVGELLNTEQATNAVAAEPVEVVELAG